MIARGDARGIRPLADLHDVLRVLASIPTTSYFDTYAFGARDLPFGLAKHSDGRELRRLFCSPCSYAALSVWPCGRQPSHTLADDLAALTEAEATSLLMGCVLILACFFTAQNTLYRGIHFLFVMPALTALASHAKARQSHRLPMIATVLILLLMDWEPLRRHLDPAQSSERACLLHYAPLMNFAYGCCARLIWWWVIAILTAFLISLAWPVSLVARIAPLWDEFAGIKLSFRAQQNHRMRLRSFQRDHVPSPLRLAGRDRVWRAAASTIAAPSGPGPGRSTGRTWSVLRHQGRCDSRSRHAGHWRALDRRRMYAGQPDVPSECILLHWMKRSIQAPMRNTRRVSSIRCTPPAEAGCRPLRPIIPKRRQ